MCTQRSMCARGRASRVFVLTETSPCILTVHIREDISAHDGTCTNVAYMHVHMSTKSPTHVRADVSMHVHAPKPIAQLAHA